MIQEITENHRKFLSHLDASAGSIWLVAKMLNARGYNIKIPATTKAPVHADWKSHADQGDLYISRLGNPEERVEVKCLGVEFSCAKDWPFGNKFIVCAKHSFDRAQPKPFAFIILSKSKSFAAAVFASDFQSWTYEKRIDSRYDSVSQEFYFSPMESVHFFKMPFCLDSYKNN